MILRCVSNKTENENLVIGALYECFSDPNDDTIIWIKFENPIKGGLTQMAYRTDFVNKKEWRKIQLGKLI